MAQLTAQPIKVKNTAIAPVDPVVLRAELLRPIPPLSLRVLLIGLAVFGVFAWSIAGTNTNLGTLLGGLPDIWRFLVRTFPPEFALTRGTDMTYTLFGTDFIIGFPRIITSIAETIQMALIGTLGAVILSIPFGLLAARNVSPHPAVYRTTRFILNTLRSIPELIYGLIFVAAVGLGPFPGVLALMFGSIGSISRLFAETIEQIDPQQVLALRATGAGSAQTFIYAVLPQAFPLMISYSLIYFEHNVRGATILGVVGAGGVGFELQTYISLFQYDKLLGAVIVLVVAVTVIDRFSSYVRSRFI
ncbi:MAG: phosphonate ABC transporter, permease protein PhnE [Armatimonadetes bacterium]|nr:phosphonate ABC transporter, permease protein PhnE [Anaerolineae bacterium]